MPSRPDYLLDVNALVALLDEVHVHHRAAIKWFQTPDLRWALCPLTETGLLRYMSNPKLGGVSIGEATRMLERMAQHPGYHYQPATGDWRALAGPFLPHLFGYKQITDAYLLGLAVR